jgi:hypothetical protein
MARGDWGVAGRRKAARSAECRGGEEGDAPKTKPVGKPAAKPTPKVETTGTPVETVETTATT